MAKKTLKNSFFTTSLVVTGFILFIAFLLFLIPNLAIFQGRQHIQRTRTAEVEELMQSHPDFFRSVFSTIIPEVLACQAQPQKNCRAQARTQIESFYTPSEGPTREYWGQRTGEKLSLIGNAPFYFVTLNEDKLVKLFLSGNLEIETINTKEEKQVAEFLNDQRDDLNGKEYLKDLYSEVEVFVPYELDGKRVGAVVFLHGD